MKNKILRLILLIALIGFSYNLMAKISITSVEVTQPKCGGDGSIKIITNASGFLYSFNGGTSWSVSPKSYVRKNNLTAGNYYIQVKEGTTATPVVYSGNPVALNEGQSASIDAYDVINASDCTTEDGSIRIVGDGAPFECSIDGGSTWQDFSHYFTIFSVGAGTYSASNIVVKSTTGCETVWTGSDITVGDQAMINVQGITSTTGTPSCIGVEDGWATFSIINEDYQYSVDGQAYQNPDYTYTNLVGGVTHTFIASYNNCTYLGPDFDIPNPQQAIIDDVTVIGSAISVSAHEETGSDNGIARQDMGDIIYSIDNGDTFQESNDFTGLTPGDYNIVIKYGECETSYSANPVTINEAGPNVLTGTVTVTGGNQYLDEIEAVVTETNNTGNLSYQWKRDGSPISGATSNLYTLTADDIATTITVDVTSDVEPGTISGSVGVIEKADQAAPAAPTMASKTHNTITLTATSGYEYAMNNGEWQESAEFTGLDAETGYSFTQRLAETETHNASPESASTDITTDPEPAVTYTVNFTVTEDTDPVADATISFNGTDYTTNAGGDVSIADVAPGTYNYTITAAGYLEETGTITVSSSNVNESIEMEAIRFTGTVTTVTDGTLQFGETITLDLSNVITNIDQQDIRFQWYAGDDHSGFETVNGATGISFTIDQSSILRQFYCIVSNTVNSATIQSNTSEAATKADQETPAAPTVESTTTTTIYLNEVEGCEYAIDGGEWGSTFEFTGLTEDTEYSFTQRYAETSTHNASETSEALLASTEAAAINVLTGTVTITGTLQFDEELTAEVSDDNNTGTLSYQWKRDYSDITNQTASTYTLVEDDIATTISVEVSSSVETGTITGAASATIEKADQDTPAAPTLQDKTYNSITLNTETGCEYCVYPSMVAVNPDNLPWQTSPIFTGLNPDTEYECKQRFTATETHNASPSSSSLLVTTDEESSSTPEFESINNTTFVNLQDECFGATVEIIIAEDGNTVEFQSGSNTNLIAGQSIRFLPGTVIEPGAYVHAWITDDNTFCDGLPESIVRIQEPERKSLELVPENEDENEFVSDLKTLKVYPNPSNGRFTIDIRGCEESNDVVVYNSMGQLVKQYRIWNKGEIEMCDVKKGIYLVKVKNSSLFQRIVIR